jgi:hypothetical protein
VNEQLGIVAELASRRAAYSRYIWKPPVVRGERPRPSVPETTRRIFEDVADILVSQDIHIRPRDDDPVRDCLLAVTRAFNCPLAAILCRSHTPWTVSVRDAAALILRERGMSLMAIGRRIGRDHTTIMAALKRARKRLEDNPKWRDCYLEAAHRAPATLAGAK